LRDPDDGEQEPTRQDDSNHSVTSRYVYYSG